MADETGQAGAAGAPTATVETANAAPPAGTGAPDGATDSASQTPDIFAQLATLDADEIIAKHPKLAGRLGTLAQKQAQDVARREIEAFKQAEQQRIAAEAYQREQDERIRLAREDPDRLAEQILAEAAEAGRNVERSQLWSEYENQTRARLQQQIDSVYQQPGVKEIWESGDETVRQKLDYRRYKDFTSFVVGVADVIADDRANKKGESIAKARLEALQADSQTQQFRRDGAQVTDLGLGGGPPAGHVFTREEIAGMDTATYRKFKAAIYEQEANGLIV